MRDGSDLRENMRAACARYRELAGEARLELHVWVGGSTWTDLVLPREQPVGCGDIVSDAGYVKIIELNGRQPLDLDGRPRVRGDLRVLIIGDPQWHEEIILSGALDALHTVSSLLDMTSEVSFCLANHPGKTP